MVQELFTEVLQDIAAHPTTIIIEVVQFAILILLVWAVAIGFGQRRGILSRTLENRRERIAEALAWAETAEPDLARARAEADERIAAARSEAASTLVAARAEARAVGERIGLEVEAQLEQMRMHAEETLATELREMQAEVRDRLVELVAGATRSILNESYGVSEQRALIQKAILGSISHMGDGESGDAEESERANVSAAGLKVKRGDAKTA